MPYNAALVSADARREPVMGIRMSPPSGGLPPLTTPPHPLGHHRAPALRGSLPPALRFTRGGVSRLACVSPALAAACSGRAGASETPGLKPPGLNETLFPRSSWCRSHRCSPSLAPRFLRQCFGC